MCPDGYTLHFNRYHHQILTQSVFLQYLELFFCFFEKNVLKEKIIKKRFFNAISCPDGYTLQFYIYHHQILTQSVFLQYLELFFCFFEKNVLKEKIIKKRFFNAISCPDGYTLQFYRYHHQILTQSVFLQYLEQFFCFFEKNILKEKNN